VRVTFEESIAELFNAKRCDNTTTQSWLVGPKIEISPCSAVRCGASRNTLHSPCEEKTECKNDSSCQNKTHRELTALFRELQLQRVRAQGE
jgi:hypothetical protein